MHRRTTHAARLGAVAAIAALALGTGCSSDRPANEPNLSTPGPPLPSVSTSTPASPTVTPSPSASPTG